AIDVAHREDLRVELAEHLPLAVVQRTDRDQGDAAGRNRGQTPAVPAEPVSGQAEHSGEHHAVDVSARAGKGTFQTTARCNPARPPGPCTSASPASVPRATEWS